MVQHGEVAAVHLVGRAAKPITHDATHERGGEETIIATQHEARRHRRRRGRGGADRVADDEVATAPIASTTTSA